MEFCWDHTDLEKQKKKKGGEDEVTGEHELSPRASVYVVVSVSVCTDASTLNLEFLVDTVI